MSVTRYSLDHYLIEIAFEQFAHAVFGKGGCYLLAQELLACDIEQCPNIGYFVGEELEGVLVRWVNLTRIVTILKIGKIERQGVCFGVVFVFVCHLHEVNRGAWVNHGATLKTFRKADIEFIQELRAFLLTKVVYIVICIGAHLDELLIWRKIHGLDVGTIIAKWQEDYLSRSEFSIINPSWDYLQFYRFRFLIEDKWTKPIE